MKIRRTDLAEEAHELWREFRENQEELGDLSGIRFVEEEKSALRITRVGVLNEKGAKALGKPCGNYITITLEEGVQGELFDTWVKSLQEEIQKLISDLPSKAPVLVVGLGNLAITPDAIGPQVQSLTAVTRHLVEQLPDYFGGLRPVSALSAGVLGTTGIESSALIRGVCQEIQPSCVIAVDALASRGLHRVCRTVQLADTGITPGSGVGNHRGRLDQDSLGVPVIAIGVPTVVDGATLVADLLEQEEESQLPGGDFFVTPKEIDSHVAKLSKLIASGINQALNPSLTEDDFMLLLS